MILNNSLTSVTRAGLAQLALAVVLFALSVFLSEWRQFAALEVAIYFTLAGNALVIYGAMQRSLPFRKIATTWLPLTRKSQVCFILLFGAGALMAEEGQTAAGIALMTIGYGSLVVNSMLRLIGRGESSATNQG